MKRLFLAAFLLAGPAWAKRLPRPLILPLDDGVYRFVLKGNSGPDRNGVYQGGHVAAYRKATGEKLWERYLYRVKLDPAVERDLQDVFIKKMYLSSRERLVLQNEWGQWFVLDRRTGASIHTDRFKREKDDPSVYYTGSNRVEPILQGNFLVQAAQDSNFGHQMVRAYDVPTGRLLWEKRLNCPRGTEGWSPIAFMYLDDQGVVQVTFDDSSACRLDVRTGKTLR
jgi:outer membrane protein assembly factor BamB